MTYDHAKLRAELVLEEGDRPDVYRCPAGYLTVGIGHNLEAKPLSRAVRDAIFSEDVQDAELDLDALLTPAWRGLEDDLQRVLVNMSFQLGRSGLNSFDRFLNLVLELIKATDPLERKRLRELGAREMLDSKWHRDDSPMRARRLAARWLGPP